ncbi:MAG: response regulator [Chitinophagaceae bacterium]|nr:MAG: response regulator [Chitinophagaceae bacterium]
MKCMFPAGQRYVAYVEDDEEDVELFEEVATAAGLVVQSFPDGVALLQCLGEQAATLPCLILLDLKNPVRSGPETYACLQADTRLRAIPVKYFSSSFELMEREQKQSPEVELITKPDVYSDWLSLVTRLADFCRAADAPSLP